MKRTIPLWITAATGFVLIAAHFSPYTESWGEVTMIWFDVLASIAFVLGGGNLLKLHLKKISDRAAGWGYSAITVLSFLAMLYVGLAKWGVPPADEQEFYGEAFARLPLAEFPFTYRVDGTIPEKAGTAPLPASAVRQIDQEDGRIVFRGWMADNQLHDLKEYKAELRWQCAVQRLAEAARPPAAFQGKLAYHASHEVLAFRGHMTGQDRQALESLSDSDAWARAVDELYQRTQEVAKVEVASAPEGFDDRRAKAISPALGFDPKTNVLEIQGPMSASERNALARQFPPAATLDRGSPARAAMLADLTALGSLAEDQRRAFDQVADAGWTRRQLRQVLDAAGQAEEVDKSACEMLAEQEAGAKAIVPKKKVGQDQVLSDSQVAVLDRAGAAASVDVERLAEELGRAGPFSPRQRAALADFLSKAPTLAEQKRDLALALLKAGPLTPEQEEWLLADYRRQVSWQRSVGELFAKAHLVKYPWSGEYNAQGSPFWWLYEYAMKPLTATMFALLAFFVASAAFRAFRAKNLEATLLLVTAFIILLGRTFAGTFATEWLPPVISGLRIDNLTVTIMSVFNTAGNRAIAIGIALGIASTSLKVLLGIDRSYLGSAEE